jgi:PTH1 family peptidyl-tRNA hydrolase
MIKKIIVGLGNYPSKYNNTRHNAGFLVIDKLCKIFSVELINYRDTGMYGIIKNNNYVIYVAKPTTLMNLSGNFISEILKKENIINSNLFVICDDLNTKLGKYKILLNNAKPAGHNGLKDIINKIQTIDFNTMKIGISRPENSVDIAQYVLEKFSITEKKIINKVVDEACKYLIDNFIK